MMKNIKINTQAIPFIMDEIESIDINRPLDFAFAEMTLKIFRTE